MKFSGLNSYLLRVSFSETLHQVPEYSPVVPSSCFGEYMRGKCKKCKFNWLITRKYILSKRRRLKLAVHCAANRYIACGIIRKDDEEFKPYPVEELKNKPLSKYLERSFSRICQDWRQTELAKIVEEQRKLEQRALKVFDKNTSS